MNIMKLQLKWACRIEHLASGFYHSLSKRYWKKEELAKTLGRFSREELKHGVMFGKAYHEEFGKKLITNPWAALGKTLAFLQYFIPLRWKLKTLSAVESSALGLLKKELRSERTNRYRDILRKIQPDEVRHASLYSSLYGATVTETVPDQVL